MRNKKRLLLTLTVCLLLALIGWLWWGNTAVMVHTIAVTDERVPQAFSGFRIAQISDLHNAEFGTGNERLLTRLKEAKPDIIVITGDMIDSRRTDVEKALNFADGAVEIAPTYYVTGNHEQRVGDAFAQLSEGLTGLGVHVLRGEGEILWRDGASITLLGVDDPSFYAMELPGISAEGQMLTDMLDLCRESGYTVLLAHRPELVETYAQAGVELVFSGHAHGGQVRLPFVGGLVAPGQGLFPQYDGGLYTIGNTNLVVSRGLGNSIIPLRVNNRPEIVLAELRSK